MSIDHYYSFIILTITMIILIMNCIVHSYIEERDSSKIEIYNAITRNVYIRKN